VYLAKPLGRRSPSSDPPSGPTGIVSDPRSVSGLALIEMMVTALLIGFLGLIGLCSDSNADRQPDRGARLSGINIAINTIVTHRNTYVNRSQNDRGGFTLVEAVVSIALIGIGVASTLGALTKFNAIADMSRNGTGAYRAVMNQIDLIQSDGPFNPGKFNADGVTRQIPPELILDATRGGPLTQNNVVVYQYRDPSNNNVVIVKGTMTTSVTDLNPGSLSLYMYQAVVTLTFNYLNHDGLNHNGVTFPPFSLSMTTIRTSDI
jgi:type II secretory pathway pseudopilin PulG